MNTLLREERASALVTTLVILTVLSTLLGTVLMVFLAQYRFIRSDTHRTQARYEAEAGVYAAMARLQTNPMWRPADTLLTLPFDRSAAVSVASFGGYLLIRAKAQEGQQEAVVRAWVGEEPPARSENALVVWDTESSVNAAGATRVIGDIIVGEGGFYERAFKPEAEPFTGEVDGTIYPIPELEAPYFTAAVLEETLGQATGYVNGSNAYVPRTQAYTRRALADVLPHENPIHFTSGHRTITPDDSLLLSEPITLVATGNLSLVGPLTFEPTSQFIAGDTLFLGEGVSGVEGLFFGQQAVEMTGGSVAGHLFSPRAIRVSGTAHLAYPSVLYIAGEAAEEGGRIRITDRASVSGTIIHPRLADAPRGHAGHIRIDEHAQVRGLIFNGHETEVHGTVYGSVLTHQLYFFISPTNYVNWLRNATIDRTQLPLSFVVPLQFSKTPMLSILRWESFTRSVAPTS